MKAAATHDDVTALPQKARIGATNAKPIRDAEARELAAAWRVGERVRDGSRSFSYSDGPEHTLAGRRWASAFDRHAP